MTDAIASAGRSGYQLLPHTADVMVSAWAPTVEGCLAEAVRGMVSCFADIRTVRPERLVAFVCDAGPASELLAQVLEEAIYLVDAQDVVPVQVAVARTGDGGLVGEFGVACTARKRGSAYAAWEYSPMSPLRIVRRRTRAAARSVIGGGAVSASGGSCRRAW
jgi:SHS2 domain-containing protein